MYEAVGETPPPPVRHRMHSNLKVCCDISDDTLAVKIGEKLAEPGVSLTVPCLAARGIKHLSRFMKHSAPGEQLET